MQSLTKPKSWQQCNEWDLNANAPNSQLLLQGDYMQCRYGPRPSDRKTSFSEQGRLQCDVRLATFATRQRGKGLAQVLGRTTIATCAYLLDSSSSDTTDT